MKSKFLVKFKNINKTFSIVEGQKMNFLKFREEKKKLLVKFKDQNSFLPKNLSCE